MGKPFEVQCINALSATHQFRAGATYNECLLSEIQLDRIDVVLVSPRNPLNIGAVARAMANFGFPSLRVVDPYEPHWREAKSAVGAENLLLAARAFSSLQEAVVGCTLVVGTGTCTHRTPDQPTILLPAIAPRVAAEFERGGRIALVFGSEKRGLTRDDLAHCHLMIEIPTDARQPSMNLGQAVAVCLYELAREAPRSREKDSASKQAEPAATSAALERLALVIQSTMIASGYSPEIMHAANQHDLQVILRRLSWSESDAKRVMGLFRRILWRLRRPESS